MKRKIVNPNPEEKRKQQIEKKIYDHELQEQLIIDEEIIEEKNKKIKEEK